MDTFFFQLTYKVEDEQKNPGQITPDNIFVHYSEIFRVLSDFQHKGTVSVISSDIPFKEVQFRFTTVLFKPLTDQGCSLFKAF